MTKAFLQQLNGTVGRKEIDRLTEQVLDTPSCFPAIYALTRHEEVSVAWHATWVCEKLSCRMPALFLAPDLRQELMQRVVCCPHGGIRRLLLNILLHLPACEEIDVVFLDFCLGHMTDPDETTAGKALCMKMAYALCRHTPELVQELQACLENMEPDYYPPAVQCARKRILQEIRSRASASLSKPARRTAAPSKPHG